LDQARAWLQVLQVKVARSTGSNLQSASVGQDIMMVAVAEVNPLAKKAKIDLKDLEPYSLSECLKRPILARTSG
jgi:hypothetical protein